ncbi:MAG: nickel-responsive transcriptional regulator NikR [Gammaproteobacteria bacterium]
MRRVTISMDDDLADTFDKLMKDKGYQSRSEAFRDLLRGELGKDTIGQFTTADCVGSLSYVYNHHERQLASRLASLQHDHHDLMVSTMHVHLDHDNCIETVILRGPTDRVLQFAQGIIAEKGVRHGKFNLVPVETEAGGRAHLHRHVHARPRT